jgi:hypothetical protein
MNPTILKAPSFSVPKRTFKLGPYRAAVYLLAAVAMMFLTVRTAEAKKVTYTGFTITDGKLGSWAFHNARVYLTFESDTDDVQFIQPLIDPSNPSFGTVDILINQTGKASVLIIASDRIVAARFAPNQIFVSLDLGDTFSAPHLGARGVGFGSVTATGLEPAYPLGVEDGTVDWGDINEDNSDAVASSELAQLPLDLVNKSGLSGRAWSCVGFPNGCAAANPLHTVGMGDLYLYSSYTDSFGQPLSAGFFVTEVGESAESQLSTALFGGLFARSAHPITYHGSLLSDVTIGGNTYRGAQVNLSFAADTSTVVPFSAGHGFTNSIGKARVTVVSGAKTISAEFDPGLLYVYYDIDHASIGFGSIGPGGSQESGYPLSLTAHQDNDGLVENSSVGAVADLTLTPANASNYSPATAGLTTDLRNATTLSGAASSCIGFDPVTSTCGSLTPPALHTNKGDFYLFEPYRHDATASTSTTYSVNWGVFWAEMPSRTGEE